MWDAGGLKGSHSAAGAASPHEDQDNSTWHCATFIVRMQENLPRNYKNNLTQQQEGKQPDFFTRDGWH